MSGVENVGVEDALYLRAWYLFIARDIGIAILSVRLSVRPSVCP